MVLIGDDDVWVTLGSGNPTLSGWGHNDELWLVVRARRGSGPAALTQLGEWLFDLPDVVAMPSWIADTVRDLAMIVTPDEPDDSFPDLRIAGNLRHPLVSLLPAGPVDAVGISAPYFDPRAAAVRTIVTTMRPAHLIVALQPRMTQYDGDTLTTAMSTVPATGVRLLPEERMRHGKLVEWTASNSRAAMIGSANPTAAGLLATTLAGGNCELVAVCALDATLMPSAATSPVDVIQSRSTIPPDRDDPRGPSLVLLGARRLVDGVVVELSTTAVGPVTVEMSADAGPGFWRSVAVVDHPKVGATITIEFPTPDPLGRAVRTVTGDPAAPTISAVVFLTDTDRCAAHDDSAPRVTRDYPPHELFTDPALATRFARDLEQLIDNFAEHPAAGTTDAGQSGKVATPEDRYGAWVRDTEAMFGPSLAAWVYPGLLRAAIPGAATAWGIGTPSGEDIDPDDDAEGDPDESTDSVDVTPLQDEQVVRDRNLSTGTGNSSPAGSAAP